ncbi:MAG: NAD(P)-dependent oxidoreductase [Pseudanabaenaceae cyanobacterium bins.68]|nr:NAD(P)-dependent oxidoreductase [Pseudanabaenaceae cyanobacterium bins.68]
MTKQIFITGASGCVGHYLVEALLNQTDWQLFLLVRQPQKLQVRFRDPQQRSRLEILQGTMQDMGRYADLLAKMDYAVSTAACWGGAAEVYSTNVDKTLELFSYLDPSRCVRAIYFSTASILDSHNQLLPQAEAIGPDYIRSKYICLTKIEQLPIRDRLISVFPTLVFGGDDQYPKSHLSAWLAQVAAQVNLLRWFKADASFHFIHAQDIAQVVSHLLTQSTADLPQPFPQRLVLGMASMTANQAIAETAAFYHKRLWWQFELNLKLIQLLIKLFRIQVGAWDYFCIQQRHFTYEITRPENFGLTSAYPHLSNLLAEL